MIVGAALLQHQVVKAVGHGVHSINYTTNINVKH